MTARVSCCRAGARLQARLTTESAQLRNALRRLERRRARAWSTTERVKAVELQQRRVSEQQARLDEHVCAQPWPETRRQSTRPADVELVTCCSCGVRVLPAPGLDVTVCPHTPTPLAGVPIGLARSLTALESALAMLGRPCTACACSPALLADLDPDPDCYGLTPAGDGCRVDSRARAYAALAGIGVGGTRRVGDRLVLQALLVELRARAHGRVVIAPSATSAPLILAALGGEAT